MLIGNVLEPALVGSAFLAYVLYHVYFWQRCKRRPMNTTVGHNHEARLLWCRAVMREGKELVAVQTIRNTLMSSSLLASTSLTLSVVTAAYLIDTINRHGPLGLDLLASSYLRPIHKFFGVIICFTIAFYCYMQSVRASNHVGYLLGVPLTGSRHFTPQYVARVLNRGADFHTAGTRIFYLAFILVLWIFGPLPPTILTILLVPHLWYLDRADPSDIDSGAAMTERDANKSDKDVDMSERDANKSKRDAGISERDADIVKSEKAVMLKKDATPIMYEKETIHPNPKEKAIPSNSKEKAATSNFKKKALPSTSTPTSPV